VHPDFAWACDYVAKLWVLLAPPHEKATPVTKKNIKMLFCFFFVATYLNAAVLLRQRTHTPLPRPIPARYISAIVREGFAGCCRPRWGGWGSDDNNNDPRGDDGIDDVRPRPPHTTINLFNEEKD
jgi:hypothetical protein